MYRLPKTVILTDERGLFYKMDIFVTRFLPHTQPPAKKITIFQKLSRKCEIGQRRAKNAEKNHVTEKVLT